MVKYRQLWLYLTVKNKVATFYVLWDLNLLAKKFILVNGAPQLFGKKHSLKYLPLCSAEKIVCVCVWI